jgi:hypothetical protein
MEEDDMVVTGSLGTRVAKHSLPVGNFDHGKVVRLTPDSIPGWRNEFELRNLTPGSSTYAVLRWAPAGYVWGVLFVADFETARLIAEGKHENDMGLPWRK